MGEVTAIAKTRIRHGDTLFDVSTINRESSADDSRYNETMVWKVMDSQTDSILVYQGDDLTGSILEHLAVVWRIFETGNPKEVEK